MARRKDDGLLTELVAEAHQLPIWVGLPVAAIVYLLLALVVPAILGGSVVSRAFGQLSSMFAPWVALVMAGASAVGTAQRAFRGFSDRGLFNRQSDLGSVRALSWGDFERLVSEAYRREGYSVERTPNGADGGVDLVLRRDGTTVLVQCKHWRARQVRVQTVRELAGVVAARGANRGIVVTDGELTRDAAAFAREAGIDVVDGKRFLRLLGLPQETALEPRASGARRSCPQCGSAMIRRTARRGAHAGQDFFGCSRYPECRGTQPV